MTSQPLPRWRPLIFAAIAALIGAYMVAAHYLGAPLGSSGPDIDQVWWAARAVAHRQDAYAGVWPSGSSSHPFESPFFYPLTAALIALPLAPFSLDGARLLWVAGGAAVFGYAVGRVKPYLWPTLFGMPFLIALRSAQWSPLLTGAMLLPALGWLAAGKPNLGVVMLAATRSRRDVFFLVGGGLALVLVSLALDPRWPWRWQEALSHSIHFRRFLVRPGGFLLLLALLRWRNPDARLLLALAVVPVTGFAYDALPACLAARTRLQSAILTVVSQIGALLAPHLPYAHGYADLTGRTGPWLSGLASCLRWF